MKNKNKDLILKYTFLFLLFSLIGRIYEFDLIISSGTLNYLAHFPTAIYTFLFSTPYGLAGLILYFLISTLNKNELTSNVVFKIFTCVFAINLIELFAGLLALNTIGVMPWDYSHHILNYKGLISLPITIRWTIFAILFNWFGYNKIKTFMKNPLSKKIKKLTVGTLIVYAMYLITIISLKFTGVI